MVDTQKNLLPLPSPNLQWLSIDEELWQMAEERAQEILCIIQPNVVSEMNRKDVIHYIQGLIKDYYGAEVFPFGSVPLKTYLPDGDIDLTVLSYESVEEDLAQAVCSILEKGNDYEYEVKDIQHIRAQVQVVKCTVKDIAVDISFNQIAGLSTLSFLEQFDQLVGRNHLFKRSIILIKAWCYYESRILGAHHGLISTYAVETLVLYIINLFHSSARGPLEVLYRFLDYYSSFEWDKYCVSINGPVPTSSLPEIVVKPECDQGELLLRKEFLRNHMDMFSVPARVCETVTREFPVKHLNILDPLRGDNNLGRSVSRGNLHRIRFALSFGARKLKDILALPGESMGAALEKFFVNTLERNGKGQRPDVDVPVPAFGTGKSEEPVLVGDLYTHYESHVDVPVPAFGTGTSEEPVLNGDLDIYYGSNVDVTVPAFDAGTSEEPVLSEDLDIYYYGSLQNYQLYHNYTMPLTAHLSSSLSLSQADVNALPAQQNWGMYYQTGTDVYVPTTQTLYHPNTSQQFVETYGLEESGTSRGTGTYIPDMTRNCCWDMHKTVRRPRKSASVNRDVLPKSSKRKELVKVNSETDTKQNSRPFELSNEDFPLLPGILKTSPSTAQESVQLTSESEDPEQAKNSSPSVLNIEFGTHKKSQSLMELHMPVKDEKADSGVASTPNTTPRAPKTDVESKEEFPELPRRK